jgi:phage-related protein (TIGR01555 family)
MAKKRTRANQRDRPATAPPPSAPVFPRIPPALTLDAFSNPLARLGFDTPNLLEYTRYEKTNFTQRYNTLTALYRENWIVKRLIDVVAEDMIKNWYRINSQLAPDAKQQIIRLERKTGLRSKILDGLKWGRLYGGAAAIIVIDGHEDILDTPLDYDFILPGSFKGLIVVDRWSGISPSLEIVEDINDPDFGLPKYYDITTESFGYGVRVHHSRVLRFLGRRMPYIEELDETYWGTSEIEHVFAEIKKYDNTSHNIANLVFQANLSVFKMDGFDQLGSAPVSVINDLYNTLSMQNWMKSNQSMQIIGKDDNMEQHQYSFAGLSDIYEMFMLDVSGASAIPVTKLFGRSPAGMNATGESDMTNYYDGIEEQQQATLRPIIDKILPIMCMSEFGSIPDDLDFEFEPVRRPSEDERKNILTQTSTAIIGAFNAGITSQKISLKELRESARATGMWNNITDEDIEKADGDFGIGGEPPDVMEFAGEPDAAGSVAEYERESEQSN